MSGHYFDATPAVGSARRTIPLVLPDLTVELVTDRGVFSAERVDPGTRLLLLEAPPPPTAAGVRLLDLGCGYGPVAIALAHRAPAAEVWAVDVNERAVALCATNARALGLVGVHPLVTPPDGVPAELPDGLRFDAIYSNPPIRIGKSALHALLLRWLERLTPTGHAYLVVQKHLGADSLARWLTEQGFAVARATARAGYRILDVTPGDRP